MSSSRDQEIKTDFGHRLRKAREARGWTKEKLANKAETSVSQIYRIEKGINDPKLTTIARIAAVLGMEGWKLLKGE